MKYINNKVNDVKIAYIGGGSRGWAWGLMSDLAAADDFSGSVYLYDTDYEAAKNNEIIGNKFKDAEGAQSVWNYKAVEHIGEALSGADFVVISILPGTFDEMDSDVHAPEKYGIYQSVGDTSGPGGIVRAMRTLPMFEEIALAVKEYCPRAWVINYTNPMTLCTAQLYKTFPEIKAFGCCHEVFGTQKFLANVADDILGIKDIKREDVKVNVVGVNHFTWLTEAKYKDIDLIPLYKEFCIKHKDTKYLKKSDENWLNSRFITRERVKMDLFLKTGVIAAAGDRHLAEFCPGSWYLQNLDRVEEMGFSLTTVKWRKEDLAERLAKAEKLISGEEKVKLTETGEDGVRQMRALAGLHTFVTNVNLPNMGQIENLPMGAVVETNAVFSDNKVTPVLSGAIPNNVNQLVSKISCEQMALLDAITSRDLEKIFFVFCSDPNVTCGMDDARKLFKEMIENTKKYLQDYDVAGFTEKI